MVLDQIPLLLKSEIIKNWQLGQENALHLQYHYIMHNVENYCLIHLYIESGV